MKNFIDKFRELYLKSISDDNSQLRSYAKFERFVIKEIEKTKEKEIKRMAKLIAGEILICYSEGQPTSRLTSLANKL